MCSDYGTTVIHFDRFDDDSREVIEEVWAIFYSEGKTPILNVSSSLAIVAVFTQFFTAFASAVLVQTSSDPRYSSVRIARS